MAWQSMPLRWIRARRWLCKTSMPSPSRMETPWPVKAEVVCQVWTRESRCPVGGIHSFTLWPPLPRKLLRLEELVRGHPYGERIPQHDPSLYAARGSQLVPHIGLDKVLLHAVATLVEEAKFSLR